MAFIKFVRSSKTTYVYLMDYIPVHKRSKSSNKERQVIKKLGNVQDALLRLEIWQRHPDKIPSSIINVVTSEHIDKWIDSILQRGNIHV